MGIVHRDLKHLNILIKNTGNTPKVKIADFGMAAKLKEGQNIQKIAGTIGFMAPEIILDQPSDFKADVWSLGVLLYALISSGVPFSGEDRNETAYKILTNELSFSRSVWRTVSEDCKDLLRSMLNKDQCKRPSLKEVMQHRWFH